MSRYALLDRRNIQLKPLANRGHDLTVDRMRPLSPPEKSLDGSDFRDFIRAIRQSRRDNWPVIAMIGGHPIKLGLSRFLIDLIDRGWITHLATNGAGIIHDFELAMAGGTSEDVAKWIQRGQFGLWQETGRLNDIIRQAADRGEGLGEAVGRVIETERFPHRDVSLCAAGWRNGIPVTSHVTIGGDIIHAHANCDGAAFGTQWSYKIRLERMSPRITARTSNGTWFHAATTSCSPESTACWVSPWNLSICSADAAPRMSSEANIIAGKAFMSGLQSGSIPAVSMK